MSTELLLSSAAPAAQIDISFQGDASYAGTRMFVDNNGTVSVGAIQLLVTGPNSLSLNASAYGLSYPDSLLSINPLGDGQNILILQNTANGVSIVDAGAKHVWLATLSGPDRFYPFTWATGSELLLGSSTVYDTFGGHIPNVQIYLYGEGTYFYSEYVAEPKTALLLGLGLTAFRLARRSVR